MPNYRRLRIAGGRYFFTVNLADRRSSLLTDRVEDLRFAVRRARALAPFRIEDTVAYCKRFPRSSARLCELSAVLGAFKDACRAAARWPSAILERPCARRTRFPWSGRTDGLSVEPTDDRQRIKRASRVRHQTVCRS